MRLVQITVCVCVTDVDVAVTNLRVVCKIITCVSAFTCTIQITVYVYVCDGCGRVRNEFAGRVQKHHVRFRNGYINRS